MHEISPDEINALFEHTRKLKRSKETQLVDSWDREQQHNEDQYIFARKRERSRQRSLTRIINPSERNEDQYAFAKTTDSTFSPEESRSNY